MAPSSEIEKDSKNRRPGIRSVTTVDWRRFHRGGEVWNTLKKPSPIKLTGPICLGGFSRSLKQILKTGLNSITCHFGWLVRAEERGIEKVFRALAGADGQPTPARGSPDIG